MFIQEVGEGDNMDYFYLKYTEDVIKKDTAAISETR